MAKASSWRRLSSQLLRPRRPPALPEIACAGTIFPVIRAFMPSNSDWLQRSGWMRLSVTKASDGDRICTSSKRELHQNVSRLPNRKQHPISLERGPWSPLKLYIGTESRSSK
jgi:hypothetical protein